MSANETGAPPAGEARATAAAPGAWWDALNLRDLHGARIEPAGHWMVVVFLGQECPVSNASVPTLNRLAKEFAPRGVTLIGAYVDPTASIGELRRHAADYAMAFVTADDRQQRLAHAVHATYTPEVAVFSADGAELYLGRIDDRVGELGVTRPTAVHHDLRDVLDALIAGQTGPFPSHPGYGCTMPQAVRP